MKKLKLSLFVLFAATTLSSCGVMTSHQSSITERQTRGIEPNHIVSTTPLVLDVEPIGGDKVSYTAIFGCNTPSLNEQAIEAFKVETLSQANEKHGADLMVAATYTIVYSPSSISITVSGFPAKYTKLRSAKDGECGFVKSIVVE